MTVRGSSERYREGEKERQMERERERERMRKPQHSRDNTMKGETENIRIAQGKDALPKDLKSASKIIKNTIKWQK